MPNKAVDTSDDGLSPSVLSLRFLRTARGSPTLCHLRRSAFQNQRFTLMGYIAVAAVCDFVPLELSGYEATKPVAIREFGKAQNRLHNAHSLNLALGPSDKIIDSIKSNRGDIVLATFKPTAGDSEVDLLSKSANNLRRSNSDLVFGNDIRNKRNLVVTCDGNTLRGADRNDTVQIFCTELLDRLESA